MLKAEILMNLWMDIEHVSKIKRPNLITITHSKVSNNIITHF